MKQLSSPSPLRSFFSTLLAPADVRIDGDRGWDIQIQDERIFRRMLLGGSLAFGESYMDGWWDCEQMDRLFTHLIGQHVERHANRVSPFVAMLNIARNGLMNLQSIRRAFQVGKKHYDIGNTLFQRMLDPTMSYSCGYWAEADNLHAAQLAKLHLICRKLQLEPGMKLLEIGCGWGCLAEVAARDYGVEVVGLTVSAEQKALADKRLQGLPVEIRLEDYRHTQGHFDRIVSIGMFEHVGLKNYRAYFSQAQRLLKDDGLFLLHSIGSALPTAYTDPWIDKYIFPNGFIPSLSQVMPAIEPYFVVEDLHNFGADYDRTLMAWWDNFQAAWPELQADYDDRFYRMWRYYLMSSAGFFRSHQGQLWQFVLTKPGKRGVYRSLR